MRLKEAIHAILRHVWSICVSNDGYIHYLRKHGVRVGKNVRFRNPAHTVIDLTRPCLIEFGNDIDINDNFTILTHDFGSFVFRNVFKDFVNSSGKVIIGNNIVFGHNVTVLKGVSIGDNCIIGAGSLITKSIPPNSVVVGSPAKVLCSLDDYYSKRKSEQIKEALEYARVLTEKKGIENVKVEDFTEEWVLFLDEKEYNLNPRLKKNVDSRLKGYIDVKDFLSRVKPFKSYDDFIKYGNKE